MKLGRKISLVYSAIAIGLLLVTGIVFYVLFSKYTETAYYQYLEEKARLIAMERFGQDDMDSVKYQNVLIRRQSSIPTSKELFVNIAERREADLLLSEYLDREQLVALYKGEVVNFEHNKEVGTALLYYDNEGTFAVMVLSRNPYGEKIAETVGWSLLLLLLLASVVLYLISRLYASRIVNRIAQDYQTEKLFVNNASHEINNPLTAIQGECEVALMRERSAHEYKQSLSRIAEETSRIINIIGQLLHFSHSRSVNEDLDPIRISGFLQQFADEHTLVDVRNDFTVVMKEELLQMAVKNLVSNAHKYANGHPVVIRADHKQIEIIDHGIGIPEADLPHIFDPFYRASNTSGRHGNGIGLSLSKSLLEKYGATISVKKTGHEGTTFVVDFR